MIIIEVGGVRVVGVPAQQVEALITSGGGIDKRGGFHFFQGHLNTNLSQLCLDLLRYLGG